MILSHICYSVCKQKVSENELWGMVAAFSNDVKLLLVLTSNSDSHFHFRGYESIDLASLWSYRRLNGCVLASIVGPFDMHNHTLRPLFSLIHSKIKQLVTDANSDAKRFVMLFHRRTEWRIHWIIWAPQQPAFSIRLPICQPSYPITYPSALLLIYSFTHSMTLPFLISFLQIYCFSTFTNEIRGTMKKW